MKEKTKAKIVFIAIILLALTLRVAGLEKNPPSPNWDEVSHGYNAYSILKTGKDEWGKLFPTIFRAYGDYKLPVYIYITALFELLLGLNTLAVRLPSALAGVGVVILTYLVVRELFGNKMHAAIAAFLVAIEPWSLFLSRGAFEANLALFLIVGGVYFFLLGAKRPKLLILSALFFGLSVWTYNSARVFVPLLVFSLLVIYRGVLKKTYKSASTTTHISLLLVAVFMVPMFFQLLKPVGQARYDLVSIIDEGAVGKIIEARQESDLTPFLNRLVNNRVTYFSKEFIGNYFSHFSPSFLITTGGEHYQFSVQDYGLIYKINLPFMFIGLVVLLKEKSKKSALILSWIILSPLASSITREAPHALRAIMMLPMPMILSAYGVVTVIDFLGGRKVFWRRVVVLAYVALSICALSAYWRIYSDDYRKTYSWAWQYGYEQAVSYIRPRYEDYDNIIITKKYGEPHEFVLFFWPWDPSQFQEDSKLVRFFQSDWYWVDAFDKFFFVNDWEIPDSYNQDFVLESGGGVGCVKSVRCLLITSPENAPTGWRKLEVINFLDGKAAFEIYDNSVN